MRLGEVRRLWIGVGAALVACGGDPGFRFNAPITVDRPAPFVQLPLSADVYGRSVQPDLQDVRVVDARGERVPFAILAPRVAEEERIEQRRDAVLYPLPAAPAAGGGWRSPVEVTVQGDRISVKRLDQPPTPGTPGRRSGGWLIDLGERKRGDPRPNALRMEWSGPAEFSATFGLETSDDLSSWRGGGGGQLMALASATGPLTQPTVRLPDDGGRFVRLVWADPVSAPVLVGAKVLAAEQRSVALDPPSERVLSPSSEPAGRALYFDLGGGLPVVEIDLRLAPGTRVAPVRLEGRTTLDQPWSELGAGVFYRLERGGAEVSTSPPLALRANVRYIRVVPDARAAALDVGETKLVVHVQLASLVFANQGQAPFRLMVGSRYAASSALPVSTVVPLLDDERPRFGRASLGDWTEVAAVATAEEWERTWAALRPGLLWAVLLLGVAGLGFMVWRLARGGSPT